MTRRIARRFALLLVVFVTILMLVKLDAGAGKRTRYVEFLGREVPVSELNEKVRMHDASFKDYGAAGKQGARSAFGLTGEGVTIAIVDTGVSLGIEEGEQHEQLDGNTVVGDVDFIDPGTPGDDCNGHGTHVASIAAGNGGASKDAKFYRGVAPRASILAIRVLDCLGRGTVGTVISGIAWAVENGADIISMSLGTGGSNTALNDAVGVAVSRGVVVIASAGNGGPNLDTIGSPAIAVGAIAVGASSEWSGGKREERSFGPYLAYFSSRGKGYGSTYPLKPDIVAPGVTVKAADFPFADGYVTFSGTSMSAPYVAGTVALMLELNPLTPVEVRDILRSTALNAGPSVNGAWDPDWGFGLINTFDAVAAASNSESRKDIFPFHYFDTRNHGSGDNYGSYRAEVVNIGTGSAAFGPPEMPTKKSQPMAFTINVYTFGVDLDAILVDLTNPGARSEYPWSVVTASLPSSSPARTEAFGALPPTVGVGGGYRLFVGPSMPFDDRATSYSFGVDLFYGVG